MVLMTGIFPVLTIRYKTGQDGYDMSYIQVGHSGKNAVEECYKRLEERDLRTHT